MMRLAGSLMTGALAASLQCLACGGDVETATSSGGGSGGNSSTSSTETGGAGGETTTPTSTSTSTSSTSTSTGGSGGAGAAGGTGGAPPDVCAELAPIALSDPVAKDAGGDGTWSPGESAAVFVTMTNTSAADINYPGVTMSSDDPLVTAGAPYNAFFLLGGGASMPIEVGFAADASIPTGTVVHFVAKLTDIQGNVCESLPALDFDLTIE